MRRMNTPPYKALRESILDSRGHPISQRYVERELRELYGGWNTGRLSTIERGLLPTDEERRQLLAFLQSRLTEHLGGNA